jgi:hypothetical protein
VIKDRQTPWKGMGIRVARLPDNNAGIMGALLNGRCVRAGDVAEVAGVVKIVAENLMTFGPDVQRRSKVF